ncbi:MAG TPA: peroxide stress protein YaaA [Mycobacteriales bacterium]|nr:peroxide stress protein YaaA [Mycobacteriales bacterium]
MLILLPPSEGKAPGGSGPPVDPSALSWPQLERHREQVLRALVTVCRRSPAKARTLLGLSEALDSDRAANAAAPTSPTMPAGHRYTGVLHDALGYPTLPVAARRRANRSVVVFSGLWGAVRPLDPLPAYRIGIGTRLPTIGALPPYWRDALYDALDAEVAADGALDLRSAGYSQMYKPSREAAAKIVTVAITGPDGKRAASSYQSKVAKGRLVRALLQLSRPGPGDVARAAESIGIDPVEGKDGLTLRCPAGWGLVNPPKDA